MESSTSRKKRGDVGASTIQKTQSKECDEGKSSREIFGVFWNEISAI